ncbi:MAG: hypothetical protein ABL879_12700 [Devosia sp.]
MDILAERTSIAPRATAAKPARSMPKWRRYLNRGGAFVVAFVAMTFAISASWRAWGVPMYADLPNVAHAAGGIGDTTYVNGIDALDANYARGFRIFEMDFNWTSDGVLVCNHDWKEYDGKAPDFLTFERTNNALPHPACTYPTATTWFKNHPQATLISDAKDRVIETNAYLRRALGDQLLPTVYDLPTALAISQNGRYPMVLATYKMKTLWDRFVLLGSMRGKRIHINAVAMSMADATAGLGLWAKLWIDAPIYSYTVNNCEPVPTLKVLGVDAIYTDFLEIDSCR